MSVHVEQRWAAANFFLSPLNASPLIFSLSSLTAKLENFFTFASLLRVNPLPF
jgi:hypothetical protein